MSELARSSEATAPELPLTEIGRANRGRLLLYCCINLLLLAVLLPTLGDKGSGLGGPYLIGVIGFIAVMQFAALLRPPRIDVADGRLSLRLLTSGPHFWMIENVADVEHDLDTVRFTFREVQHIEPWSLRSAWQKQFDKHGYHLQIVGAFSQGQIVRVRRALRLKPAHEARPGTIAEFRDKTRQLTPHITASPVLVAANVALFGAMLAFGRTHLQPTADELIRCGADYGPLTTAGEAWRLFTATFLHAGIVHLLVNMLVLCQIGPLVERLFGSLRFTGVYLFSGLWGSLCSVYIQPTTVSVGASGAIFGLYGALAAFLLRYRGTVPQRVILRYRNVTVAFVVFNLVFGFTDKHIDMAAHVGGLAAGFIAGLVLSRPLTGQAPGGRLWAIVAACAGAASVALAVAALPTNVVDFDRELSAFGRTEAIVLNRMKDLAARFDEGKLPADEFTVAVETDAVKPWGAALDHFAGLTNVPVEQRKTWSSVVQYAKLRRDAWRLLVDGVRNDNPRLIEDAQRTQAAADAIAQQLVQRNSN
jgi:membrane associated rhomboid family serine protease